LGVDAGRTFARSSVVARGTVAGAFTGSNPLAAQQLRFARRTPPELMLRLEMRVM
jgi:hypothetical protein